MSETIFQVAAKFGKKDAGILNNEGFVVTSYLADKVEMGEEIWRER